MRSPAPAAPDPSLLDAIPPSLARRTRALPVRLEGGTLHVRCAVGSQERDLDVLRVHVGAYELRSEPHPDTVRHLLAAYARHAIPRLLDDPVGLLDALLDLAVGSDASDVHLASTEVDLRAQQRIDGALHDVVRIPTSTSASLIARTKVLAGLDVAERRMPQDGRLRHATPDGPVDVRVATMPTRTGERLTLRLLPDDPSGLALDRLGLGDATVATLERAIRSTAGLILLCGPTGSGKTTTLHALLHRLVGGPRNVVTLEDPVERLILGASQTQIAPEQGLTFATGLRHLLRHDPDVLLVGEIRDRETAHLAIEAAHTGHLVLTSLHAIDAPAALTRLGELGLPGALLADTVRVVVAQRLLAVPCPDCTATPVERTCSACAGTGTRGRSAVAEVLELDGALRTLLRDGRAPSAYHRELAAATRPRLREVALARADAGLARHTDAVDMTPDESEPSGS
jgi:type II secretory ATPase GspE/PulE/Tfp pilus assembly ATPase PilB-like protein